MGGGLLKSANDTLNYIALYSVAVYNMCTEGKARIKQLTMVRISLECTCVLPICLRVPSEDIYIMEREYPTSCTLLEVGQNTLCQVCSSNVLVCSLSVVIQIIISSNGPDAHSLLNVLLEVLKAHHFDRFNKNQVDRVIFTLSHCITRAHNRGWVGGWEGGGEGGGKKNCKNLKNQTGWLSVCQDGKGQKYNKTIQWQLTAINKHRTLTHPRTCLHSKWQCPIYLYTNVCMCVLQFMRTYGVCLL